MQVFGIDLLRTQNTAPLSQHKMNPTHTLRPDALNFCQNIEPEKNLSPKCTIQ